MKINNKISEELKVGKILQNGNNLFLITFSLDINNCITYLLVNLDTHIVFLKKYKKLEDIYKEFIVEKGYNICNYKLEKEQSNKKHITNLKDCFSFIEKDNMIVNCIHSNSYYVIDLNTSKIFDRFDELKEIEKAYIFSNNQIKEFTICLQ